MRNPVPLSLLVILLAVGTSPVSAAIAPCGTTTLDTLIGAGGCRIESISASFNVFFGYTTDAGGKPATGVQTQFVLNPTGDMLGLIFTPANGTGPWTVGFTLNTDIFLDPPFQGVAITDSKDQINTGLTPNGAVMEDIQFASSADLERGFTQSPILTTGLSAFGGRQDRFFNETGLINWGNNGIPDANSVSTLSVLTLGAGSQLVSFEQDFFMESAGVFVPETPVPEPATLLLLGSGLVAAGVFGRKRLGSRKA